jgi:4-amino-4-deoxy-L-arabinose transferase-like glycosyltransferase
LNPPDGPGATDVVAAPGVAVRPASGLDVRGAAAIALFGASMLLAVAGSGKSLNYHEARYAEGAREMLERGRWLVPTIGGHPRLQKPPLLYWSIAGAMAATGSRGEVPARLPSVVASVVVALVVGDLAARSFGRTAGLLAGLAQASSVYVVVSGTLADPDMLLAAMVAAGAWSFARTMVEDGDARRRRFAIAYWAAAGLAFLVKGPIGPTLLVPASVVFAVAARRRDAIRLFLDPVGLAVFAVLVLAWPLAAIAAHPGILDAWREENLARFQGVLGRSSPFFYLYTFPWMALPWTPFAVLGAASAWREGRREPIAALALAWFATDVVLLSASAGKHDRYLAPALPALSILAARGLMDARPWVARRGRPEALFAGVLAVVWVGAVAAGLVAAWRFDTYGPNRALARRVNEATPADRPLVLVAVPHNVRVQLLYYLDRPTRHVDAPAGLPKALEGRDVEA